MSRKKIRRLTKRFSKVFDLSKKGEADEYRALLDYITKKNIDIPIAGKGKLRFVDVSLRHVKKFDDELKLSFKPAEQMAA
ncbi:hypothetical protein GF374_02710 [Candidatus Woesearchaeota archaeon]|nr:hypothetical protein [Candidatus Woesearchaeota archaeon]